MMHKRAFSCWAYFFIVDVFCEILRLKHGSYYVEHGALAAVETRRLRRRRQDRKNLAKNFPVIAKAFIAHNASTILPELDVLETSVSTNLNFGINVTFMIHRAEELAALNENLGLANFEIDEIKTQEFITDASKADPMNDNGLFLTMNSGYSTISTNYFCFRSLDGIFQTMEDISNKYPHLAQVVDIGDSFLKKYDLLVLKLTNFQSSVEKSKMFATFAIHAREYATPELGARFAEYLVNGYGKDANITTVLDNTEIHLLLQSNPDAREEAELNPYLYRRKNMNREHGWCEEGRYGIDLNRNFPHMWSTSGVDTDPCSETYPGPFPASEPEVQAIIDYIKQLFSSKKHSGVYFDVHSYGRMNIWPYTYSELAETQDDLKTLSVKLQSFNGHVLSGPSEPNFIGNASGSGIDYAYGELGVSAHALELGDTFYEDCKKFNKDIAPKNLDALFYAAKVAKAPFFTAKGPDVKNLQLSTQTVPQSSNLCITAEISSTELGTSSGLSQNIDSATAFFDKYPATSTNEQGVPMFGDFSSRTVSVHLEVKMNLSIGKYVLHVRGTDTSGYVGPLTSIYFQVCDPNDDQCGRDQSNIFGKCGSK